MADNIIYLTEPFVKHYQGTILALDGPTNSGEYDEWTSHNEKISNLNHGVYQVPDNGLGRPAEIPVHFAKPVPYFFLKQLDLYSGPCRITSIFSEDKAFMEKNKNHYVIPDGIPTLFLKSNVQGIKALLCIQLEADDFPVVVNIIDRKNGDVKIQKNLDSPGEIDLNSLPFDFYELRLNFSERKPIIVTFIKLFAHTCDLMSGGRIGLVPTVW